MKSPHATELRDQEIIANAVTWTAFQFRGRGSQRKAEHASRDAAEASARQFKEEYWQRGAMVYAVDAQGRQAYVTSF